MTAEYQCWRCGGKGWVVRGELGYGRRVERPTCDGEGKLPDTTIPLQDSQT